MKDKIIGFAIIAAIIIGFMWVSEVGPFAKEYPPMNPYSGSFEPSFTSHVGPCNYNGHNCPDKCNDWREQYGGGSKCGNCGHDIIVHGSRYPKY